MRHDVLGILFGLHLVANGAVIRTHDDVNLVSVMVKSVGMAVGAKGVTFSTADRRISVSASGTAVLETLRRQSFDGHGLRRGYH